MPRVHLGEFCPGLSTTEQDTRNAKPTHYKNMLQKPEMEKLRQFSICTETLPMTKCDAMNSWERKCLTPLCFNRSSLSDCFSILTHFSVSGHFRLCKTRAEWYSGDQKDIATMLMCTVYKLQGNVAATWFGCEFKFADGREGQWNLSVLYIFSERVKDVFNFESSCLDTLMS